jgi:hypothetical protein
VYFGVCVAERVLSSAFENSERMPNGNPGFDFICGKGFKIDCKSSILHISKRRSPHWAFYIKKNKLADYFLCIGFDNRNLLNPQHVWLIPSSLVNETNAVYIYPHDLEKWLDYERPIDKIVECCQQLKNRP